MPAHRTPGSRYAGYFEKYRKGRYLTHKQNKLFPNPAKIGVSIPAELQMRLIRFSNREWVTMSALVTAAVTAFLDKHEEL